MLLLGDDFDEYDGGFDVDAVVDEHGPDEAQTLTEPRATPHIWGLDEQEKMFLSLFASNELPHAWLFTGPQGVGKATFAYHIAKFLFVNPEADTGQDSMFGEPADEVSTVVTNPENPAVKRVLSSGHADLMVLEKPSDGRGEIKVEDTRQVIQFLQKTPAEGGWRVVIIDGAEHMTNSAQNALLKILEEPPKKTTLMLIAETPSRLLPTIRSRCRKMAFDRLPNTVIEKLIDYSGCLTDTSLDKDQALAFANGSFGHLIDFIKGDGALYFSYLIDGLSHLPHIPRKDLYELSELINMDRKKGGAQAFMAITIWWLEQVIKHMGKGETYKTMSDKEDAIIHSFMAKEKAVERLLSLWEKIKQLKNDVSWASLDTKSAVMTVFLLFENELK